MKRCVIWGCNDEYEAICNQVKYEELKGNLKCMAVLSKSACHFSKKRDGYDLISKEELKNIPFDYLIIAATKSYNEVKAEALLLGVPEQKIISSRVLKISNFDFTRYSSLRDNPVTILSDDCWGGYVYHELDLPFTSPLINIDWPKDSFCQFIQDPVYYLEQPLCMEQEGNPRKNLFPIGRLGNGNRSVLLHLVHSPSFQEAAELWKRRVARINKERIFVKFSFDETDPHKEEYLEVFQQIPYSKICIYSGNSNIPGVFYSKRFEWDWWHGKRVEYTCYKDWFRQIPNYSKVIDLLKLLNDDKDYIREQ